MKALGTPAPQPELAACVNVRMSWRTGEREYNLAPGAEEAMKAYMAKRMTMPFFANARTVRNAIDLARMSAAIRLFNEKARV